MVIKGRVIRTKKNLKSTIPLFFEVSDRLGQILLNLAIETI